MHPLLPESMLYWAQKYSDSALGEGRTMLYTFGEYVLDTTRHALCHAGVPVKLERKVYHVLAYLVQQGDRLVTKDELLEHVWPGVYVADTAVARCITALRKAVGDSRERQQVIQT